MASPPYFCPLRFSDPNFGMCITPRDLILPYFSSSSSGYYRPWKWGMQDFIKDMDATVKNDETQLKITLDVDQYRIEEISVKVNDKEIKIEGKHEERKDDYGFVSRQFSRRYELPKSCPPENVTSSLSSDGILTVIAKKTAKTEDKSKVVPIQRCGACPRMKLQEEAKCSTGTIKKNTETDAKAKGDEMHKKLTQVMLKDDTASIKNMQVSKEEKIKDSVCTTQKDCKILDVDKEAEAIHKKNSQIMLKEDHSKLLRPELLGEAVSSSTEKILAETRKVTDELIKMTEKFATSDTKASTSNTLDNKEQKNSSKMAETSVASSEKIEQSAMSTTTEITSIKSMSSEMEETQKASSSFASSMASNMAIRSEMTTDLLSDIISAELRDAAENK